MERPIPSSEAPATTAQQRHEPPLRLAEAWAAIDGDGVEVVSTDVFDTLVWRRVSEPVDVFPVIGQRLADRAMLAHDVEPAAFGRFRELAEREARRLLLAAIGSAEVRLDEIYQQIPAWLLAPGVSRQDAIGVELEVEAEVVVPDLDVVALLTAARERGKTLVACSDTYFSPEQLRALLGQPVLVAVDLRSVFTSSAERCGKSEGLLTMMAASLGVAPGRALHLGDNPVADIEAAQAAGMRAVMFERRPPALERLLERERRWLAGRGARHLATATAVRGKALHRTERRDLTPALLPYWEAGVQVYGPLFAGFADWVVEEVRASQHTRAMCLMREGAFLRDVIAAAAASSGLDIAVEPLWVNRALLNRASVFQGTQSELERLLAGRSRLTAGAALEWLGLSIGQLPEFTAHASTSLEHDELRRSLLDAIAGDEALRGHAIATSRRVRERVLDLLETVMPPEPEPLLLVDVGWAGSTQAALANLLRQVGLQRPLTGLYLVTHERAIAACDDRTRLRGYLVDAGEPEAVSAEIVRSPEVIEQICMPPHGTQLDLDEELRPVLDHVRASRQQVEAEAVRHGIRAFQREWLRYRVQLPHKFLASDENRAELRAILARSVAWPLEEEARIFGRWRHDENAGSGRTEPIAASDLPTLRYFSPKQLRDTEFSELYWPIGTAAAVDPSWARLMALAAAGDIAWDDLESELGIGPAHVWIDEGFDATKREFWDALRVNRFGLTLVRGTLAARDISTIAIRLAEAPCGARIDRLRLRLWSEAGSTPTLVDVGGAAAASELHAENLSLQPPNLFIGTNEWPVLRVRTHGRARGRIFRVDIELAMAVIALSRGTLNADEVPDLAAAVERIRERDAAIRAMQSSASWRVTAPLRAAKRRLRG